MLNRKPFIPFVVLFASVVFSGNLCGQTRYTITDVGVLGGNDNPYGFSIAESINDKGQVMGFSTAPNDQTFHPFLWQNGVMTDSGSLGYGEWAFILTIGEAINNAGQMVGAGSVFASFSSTTHAFLLTPVAAGSTPSGSVATTPVSAAEIAPTAPLHTISHVVTPRGVAIVVH